MPYKLPPDLARLCAFASTDTYRANIYDAIRVKNGVAASSDGSRLFCAKVPDQADGVYSADALRKVGQWVPLKSHGPGGFAFPEFAQLIPADPTPTHRIEVPDWAKRLKGGDLVPVLFPEDPTFGAVLHPAVPNSTAGSRCVNLQLLAPFAGDVIVASIPRGHADRDAGPWVVSANGRTDGDWFALIMPMRADGPHFVTPPNPAAPEASAA